MQTPTHDTTRFKANLRAETDGAALYTLLAEAESTPELAEVYHRLAQTEQRHAAMWRGRLEAAGAPAGEVRPSQRVRILGWLADRFGAGAILPLVMAAEDRDSHAYDTQPDARAAGLAA